MADTIRVAMAGLGIAGRIVLPWFNRTPGVELAAVADTRPPALEPFRARGLRTFDSVDAMCRSADVDVIWIATPNERHMEHVIMAADNGKHVVCEKPMALNLPQAQAMIEAVERNNVKYVQRSKVFDPPVRKMREVVASGQLGRVIQINSWNYRGWLVNNTFLSTELDTERGGGLTYRQGPHQLDIVRSIGGGLVNSVRATTGRWSQDFDTEGNYAVFLEFEDGTPALVSNNAYGYFDTGELTWGIGEGGPQVPVELLYEGKYRQMRPLDPKEKYALPRYAGPADQGTQAGLGEGRHHQPFYGLTIVSCERGDVRQSENGLYIYTDDGRSEIPCEPVAGPRNEVAELFAAVTENRPSVVDAHWGMATLEVILAIRQSSAERRDVTLEHQVPFVGLWT
ncbi:MAG: gfo/Idh/MocA family oxidoreductase [Chloroflexi bacterium]|nr:gfo/Idh/MocA family oxidoreductase [Chloroflexota bacterium]